MVNIEERLKNIESEKFCFSFIIGTYMPNNKKYTKINMFDDIFYIENEQQVKEYRDIYFILKTKEVIKNNIQNIQNMAEMMSIDSNTIGSNHCEFVLKFNNEIYKINRNLCTDEGKKLFNEFYLAIFQVLGIDKDIKKNNLINALKNWKENNTSANLETLIKNIISYDFYCAISNDKKWI